MASKALNNTANDSKQQITGISDLKPKHTTKMVHVKVLHSWSQNINHGGETMEFVLADENGHKIHASCKKTYFESKGRLLLVGVWRNIRNFQVRPAGGAYRTTNHIYKISFNQATVVTRSNFMNDELYLNLVDFQSVLSETLDEKLLIDVLGQVLDCGAVETIQCAGGYQRKKLDFTLRDINDSRIPCCIWGKLTDILHSACNQDDGLVTLLLRFAKIGKFRGEVQISNSFDASQMIINPTIPEAEPFKDMDTGDDKTLMPYESNEDSQEYINKQIDQADKRGQRDKWLLYPTKNIHEMKASTQVDKCLVTCTVYEIDMDWSWYYFGCDACQKRVIKTGTKIKKVNGTRSQLIFGKTFLWRLLSATVRVRSEICLNVASSGIASLLLPGGRTAHSRFGIPINPDEFSTCKLTQGTDKADLVKAASLIIWDEAPMMSKHCFESLDRTGRAEIVMAALNSSYLWKHVKFLQLTKNMRLLSNNLSAEESKDLQEFSQWILDIGDGKIGDGNDGESLIDIPEEFLILDAKDPIEAISSAVYGDATSLHQNNEAKFFQERAILCPTNDDVNMINQHMLDKLHGEEKKILSSDSIDASDMFSVNDQALTPDFLNRIKALGLPNHSLRLKVGCPVMLLRNIDSVGGLMNGTRLQITEMYDFMIKAKVITREKEKIGRTVLIPRLSITPSDKKLPFKMRRRQLPISIAFAITINKSQGQLYIVVSRVTSKKGLKILIVDSEGKPQRQTKNVVFKKIFDNL
uniref:ATP-dependent DNA helicase n=2 Tax=Brassica oleracea TaxID=3712 RepID=A0A0D3CZU4_BRAOL